VSRWPKPSAKRCQCQSVSRQGFDARANACQTGGLPDRESAGRQPSRPAASRAGRPRFPRPVRQRLEGIGGEHHAHQQPRYPRKYGGVPEPRRPAFAHDFVIFRPTLTIAKSRQRSAEIFLAPSRADAANKTPYCLLNGSKPRSLLINRLHDEFDLLVRPYLIDLGTVG
jgi:hypothetical protein